MECGTGPWRNKSGPLESLEKHWLILWLGVQEDWSLGDKRDKEMWDGIKAKGWQPELDRKASCVLASHPENVELSFC